MSEVLNNTMPARNGAERLSEYVCSNYDAFRNARTLIELYEELIARQGRASSALPSTPSNVRVLS